ncbi:MAG: hypothetical protein AAGN66_04215 [Acidobacteriota bacterium]
MLETVDLGATLDKAAYRKRLKALQKEMRSWGHRLYRQSRSLVIVFEGWDAAGKGGAIRRLTSKLDPRGYQVYAIAAPSGDEREHHYLWRFWTRLRSPQEKQILIFDRSWYGRVLVERVEGFARPEEWRRAYREILDFEGQLTAAGMTVVKLWIHISPEEQLRRFEARRGSHYKSWKLTDEDWRNRDRWDAYSEAVEDMLLRTSSLEAPWTLVEGEDKRWARVKILETVLAALEANESNKGSA